MQFPVASTALSDADYMGQPAAAPDQPMLDFMIVGAQKCGTTALWEYLSAHPQIGMSQPKEVHLFSAQAYSPDWSPAEIDRVYEPWFQHCTDASVLGEVTPIYMFLPEVAPELKRYNPRLKLIVLLRDSVERTISNYYMQRALGKEKLPISLALLAEPWRLWRCQNPRGKGSAYRFHSYRARSLYSGQLRNLFRCFDRDQVLVVSSAELLRNHCRTLRRVFTFLEVDYVDMAPIVALPGELHGKRRHPILSRLLWLSFWRERRSSVGLYRL